MKLVLMFSILMTSALAYSFESASLEEFRCVDQVEVLQAGFKAEIMPGYDDLDKMERIFKKYAQSAEMATVLAVNDLGGVHKQADGRYKRFEYPEATEQVARSEEAYISLHSITCRLAD